MTEEEARRTRQHFALLLILAVAIIAIGTLVFRYVEDLDIVDSLYFSVVALTTVGFGDITPETDLGKLLTILYLFIGIGIIGGLLNLFVKNSAAKRYLRDLEEKNQKKGE